MKCPQSTCQEFLIEESTESHLNHYCPGCGYEAKVEQKSPKMDRNYKPVPPIKKKSKNNR